MDGKLLTTKDAADYLGISKWTIYDLVRAGKVRPIVGFKSFRFKKSDLDGIKWERL